MDQSVDEPRRPLREPGQGRASSLATWLGELAFAFRLARRSPRFTLAAIAALGLGVGANTAIFSVVEGVLLHSLPLEDPSTLVMLWEDSTPRGGTNRVPVSPGSYLDWSNAATTLSGTAALRNESRRLTAIEEPIVPLTHAVTPSYFPLLGVELYLGRGFTEEEAQTGRDRVVILSYGLWQRVFGGDESVVGGDIELDGEQYTIVGILRPDYFSVHTFATQPDLLVPLPLESQADNRSEHTLAVYARLDHASRRDEAQRELETIAARLAEIYPTVYEGWSVRVVPLREETVGRVETTLWVLLAAVGFLLLIACANVANLTLARSLERAKEMSLRAALGASRARLTRQLLTESLVLAIAGGLTGIALAAFALRPLLSLIPAAAAVPFLDQVELNMTVLVTSLLIAVLVSLLFGLWPARSVSRMSLADSLNRAGRGFDGGRFARRFGAGLVITEVSLAVVLLSCAGLMLQSFRNLKGFDPGFDAPRILTFRNSLRGAEFEEGFQRVQHFEALAQKLQALAGVSSVSGTSFPPPLNPFRAMSFVVPGEPVDPGQEPTATSRAVMASYFETMGIALIEGRTLGTMDRADSEPVVVINEALASEHFPDRSPIGRTLRIVSAPQPEFTATMGERRIVGVVRSVRTSGANPEPMPVIYVPHAQAPVAILNLVMRTDDDPESLLKSAEAIGWSMSGEINIYNVETLSQRIGRLEWTNDVATLLLSLFAGLGLVLGAAGIYAVISFRVAQRAREIGLRMAVGANAGSVVSMVVASGIKLTAIGIGLGALLSLGLTRLLGSLLYGVAPDDAPTLVTVAATLVVVAVLATALPARRAARIDPIAALRGD